MSVSDVEQIQKFLDCVASGDIAGALGVMREDIVVEEMGDLPHSGTYQGRQGFVELLTRFGELYGGFEITDASVHDAGEFIVARMTGTFFSKASNTSISMPITEHYWMRDGKMARADIYYKNPGRFRELKYVAGARV